MSELKTIWTRKCVSLLVAVTEPTFQTQLGATANKVTGPSQWESGVCYSPTLAQSLGLEWFGPTPAEGTQLYGNVTSGGSPPYHAAEAGAAPPVPTDAVRRAYSLTTPAGRTTMGTLPTMD